AGKLMPVLTIARLTVLEASRRKLLLALALLTLVVIVLTSWGFSRLPTMKGVTSAEVRVAASQLTILVAFMFSGVLALGSTLVAAPSIASDIESGIALAVGQTFANDNIINIGVVSRLLIPTDGLWHGAIFYLEPSDFLAAAQAAGRARAGNPFFADAALPLPYLLWIAAWILIVLVLANWSFARRDL